jgi:hypothetical protein
VAFFWEDTKIGSIDVDPVAPEFVNAPELKVEAQEGRATLHWEVRHDASTPRYLVRYSNDARRSSQTLAANLAEPRLAADLDEIPGGMSAYSR